MKFKQLCTRTINLVNRRYFCANSNCNLKYIPRRTLLYVPGNDEKKIEKIKQLNVDCVVLDCEDGVAINRKSEARSTIRRMLNSNFKVKNDLAVRINPDLCDVDLGDVLSGEILPNTLVLPKVNQPSDLTLFYNSLLEKINVSKLTVPFRFIYMIESALGLINMVDITKLACSLNGLKAETVIFGADDFLADIGAIRSETMENLSYARQKFVTIAKAFQLQAIDGVHLNFKDDIGLQQSCHDSVSLGFTGKQIIHPNQIDIVQTAFMPSTENIEWATELIKEFRQYESMGKGAFTFRGNMIDKPLLLQAERIVEIVKHINK